MPGAVGKNALGKKKVDVLYNIYSEFHSALDPHPTKISLKNISDLNDLDFVFIAVDDGPSRELICKHLAERNIPFVDVGMGLYRTSRGLDGMIRMAGGDLADGGKLIGTPYIPGSNPADNEYRKQPQIGELNALNAGLAMVRFKQKLGFFNRTIQSSASVLELSTLEVDQYG
jgi:hypothetical protein